MPFSPSDITGLAAWYDASKLVLADGADVYLWPDLSGLGHDVSCRMGTDNPPAFKTNIYNGLPVIRFIGANSEFLFASASIGAVGQVFVVGKYNAATFANYNGLVGDTSTLWLVGDMGTNRWYPVGGATYYLNGVDSTATRQGPMGVLAEVGISFATPTTFTPTVGTDRFNADRYWDGDVAEVLIYNHALTPAERIQVDGYLNDKWLVSKVPVAKSLTVTSNVRQKISKTRDVVYSVRQNISKTRNVAYSVRQKVSKTQSVVYSVFIPVVALGNEVFITKLPKPVMLTTQVAQAGLLSAAPKRIDMLLSAERPHVT